MPVLVPGLGLGPAGGKAGDVSGTAGQAEAALVVGVELGRRLSPRGCTCERVRCCACGLAGERPVRDGEGLGDGVDMRVCMSCCCGVAPLGTVSDVAVGAGPSKRGERGAHGESDEARREDDARCTSAESRGDGKLYFSGGRCGLRPATTAVAVVVAVAGAGRSGAGDLHSDGERGADAEAGAEAEAERGRVRGSGTSVSPSVTVAVSGPAGVSLSPSSVITV